MCISLSVTQRRNTQIHSYYLVTIYECNVQNDKLWTGEKGSPTDVRRTCDCFLICILLKVVKRATAAHTAIQHRFDDHFSEMCDKSGLIAAFQTSISDYQD